MKKHPHSTYEKRNYNRKLTVRPSLYFDSNIAMAAREPEPIVANGKVSVEPCGYICKINHSHQYFA